jgi:hypothetical protein
MRSAGRVATGDGRGEATALDLTVSDKVAFLSECVTVEASPYTPGAGKRPPVLAGRGDLVRLWESTLNDVAASGRQHARDIILHAPRGVGKTATVLAFEDMCLREGFEVISVQAAHGNTTLAESFLRLAAARIDDGAGPWRRARRAFDRITGVNVSLLGSGAGITAQPQFPPTAHPVSPEDLATALTGLDREVRRDHPHGGVLLTVDEIQASAATDLTLLAAALQDLNRHHPDAHVMFAASGLPQTERVLDAAGVTHPDRLFDIHPLNLLLHPDDARYAIVEPARARGVAWEPAAADLVVEVTSGYPAHLQLLADETWRIATGPGLITLADAEAGVKVGAATLERRSLGPRFDQMTDRQREFVTALAVHGGRASMASLAVILARPRNSLSAAHSSLLTRGDIYAPRRGEIALTAPLFAPYLLAHYEHARSLSTTKLLSLEAMNRNVDAVLNARPGAAVPPTRAGRQPAASPARLEGERPPTPWKQPVDRPDRGAGR